MAEYFAPGVYIEELDSGRGSIEGVGTSTTAFVGVTRKGPTQTPTVVSGFAEYEAKFGPATRDSLLSIAVHHYFSNGGRTAVVVSVGLAGKRKRVAGTDLVGQAENRTGIHALTKLSGNVPAVNLLVMPDTSALATREHTFAARTSLAFCEQNRVFFLIDPPSSCSGRHGLERTLEWAKRGGSARHANAAVYFPRVEIADPSGGNDVLLVPASGAVAGVYARTDRQRGVWAAPAGAAARLFGVAGVELELSEARTRKLDRAGMNSIRPSSGRSLVVSGARTFASSRANAEWKYVNIRRLSTFIERTIDEGLQWVTFEPSDEPLWAQIRLSIASFMNYLWRSGALHGRSPREAYFVKCGRDTMTESDSLLGRVNATVGFAPLKPAEFIILRISFCASMR